MVLSLLLLTCGYHTHSSMDVKPSQYIHACHSFFLIDQLFSFLVDYCTYTSSLSFSLLFFLLFVLLLFFSILFFHFFLFTLPLPPSQCFLVFSLTHFFLSCRSSGHHHKGRREQCHTQRHLKVTLATTHAPTRTPTHAGTSLVSCSHPHPQVGLADGFRWCRTP